MAMAYGSFARPENEVPYTEYITSFDRSTIGLFNFDVNNKKDFVDFVISKSFPDFERVIKKGFVNHPNYYDTLEKQYPHCLFVYKLARDIADLYNTNFKSPINYDMILKDLENGNIIMNPYTEIDSGSGKKQSVKSVYTENINYLKYHSPVTIDDELKLKLLGVFLNNLNNHHLAHIGGTDNVSKKPTLYKDYSNIKTGTSIYMPADVILPIFIDNKINALKSSDVDNNLIALYIISMLYFMWDNPNYIVSGTSSQQDNILKTKPPGAMMIRLSTTPGNYITLTFVKDYKASKWKLQLNPKTRLIQVGDDTNAIFSNIASICEVHRELFSYSENPDVRTERPVGTQNQESYGSFSPLTTTRIVASSVPTVDSTTGFTNTVYVFDFDCTLTIKHFYYFVSDYDIFKNAYSITSTNTIYDKIRDYYLKDTIADETDKETYITPFINLFFDGQERLNKIKKMFERIGKENLYIATRGIKSNVVKILRLIDVGDLIHEDHINPLINGKEVDKDILLEDLFKTKNIFYADDNHEEHIKFINKNNPTIVRETENTTVYRGRNGNTYTFYKSLMKEGGGISEDMLDRIAKDEFVILDEEQQRGGSIAREKDYYALYMKYKHKYLEAKKLLNI